MLLIRPEWIQHEDDKGKRTSIFSLSVHPNGNRLATGGLDTKVKIWNTEPVLRKDAETDLGVPKLLAAMGLHNGTVLCLAWSNGEGRYLASGSDDNIVLIWELDTNAADGFGSAYGNLNGLGNSNVENWKAIKRLVGHESDVTDVAWAPENQYLATCGLDNFVFIWDGTNFERLKKLDCHQGFVKGLTWDPIGKYLASQSDDKTLNVYKCLDDWKLETRVKLPFETSNNVTLYRRPSWSPDGSFIATANAAERSIQIAAIVSRDKWKSEISLVGHAAAIETVKFNPVLFKPSDSDDSALTEDQSRQQYTSICAVGSQDRSISVWTTRDQRPISVAEGFFAHNVLDLDWSPDGLTLYGCSYDGSIVALSFEEVEFGCAISMDEKVQLMSKHGYKQKEVVLVESPTQLRLEEEYRLASKQAANQRFTVPATVPEPIPMVPEPLLPMPTASSESPTSGHPVPSTPTKSTGSAPALLSVPATPAVQKVTITKDGKKRIQPQFVRTLTGGPTASPTPAKLPPSRMALASSGLLATPGPALGAQTPFAWTHGPPLYAAPTSTMEMDQPSRILPVAVPLETAATGNKRKPAINGHTEGSTAKRSARGNNGNGGNGRDRLPELDNDQYAKPLQHRSVLNSQAFAHAQIRLSVPKVQTRLTKSFQHDHHTLTWSATNDFDHTKPAQVAQKAQGNVEWTTFVSSHVLLLTGNDLMVMVACEDGSLHVFTHAGRR
ncbi:HIR complex subunit [Dimargaris xerosporica]|nr:HIR complex subunit [Dimargaris xerosporica]